MDVKQLNSMHARPCMCMWTGSCSRVEDRRRVNRVANEGKRAVAMAPDRAPSLRSPSTPTIQLRVSGCWLAGAGTGATVPDLAEYSILVLVFLPDFFCVLY
jgi:hypothetical protein